MTRASESLSLCLEISSARGRAPWHTRLAFLVRGGRLGRLSVTGIRDSRSISHAYVAPKRNQTRRWSRGALCFWCPAPAAGKPRYVRRRRVARGSARHATVMPLCVTRCEKCCRREKTLCKRAELCACAVKDGRPAPLRAKRRKRLGWRKRAKARGGAAGHQIARHLAGPGGWSHQHPLGCRQPPWEAWHGHRRPSRTTHTEEQCGGRPHSRPHLRVRPVTLLPPPPCSHHHLLTES